MIFEEKYEDVLQNIEFAVIDVYRRDRELLDYDVADALAALIRLYRAEEAGRSAPQSRLDERPQRLFDAMKTMCEFRLGRSDLEGRQAGERPEPVTVGEIVQCLKRLEKSVQRWNKQNGRRGYLDFVSQFIP